MSYNSCIVNTEEINRGRNEVSNATDNTEETQRV